MKFLFKSIPEIVGAIKKTGHAPSTPSTPFTTTVDVNKIVERDEEENRELSYLEMVYRDPFFEDPSDMWKPHYREKADMEHMVLKKQKSKLKLKKRRK